jgi:hypothetical protein
MNGMDNGSNERAMKDWRARCRLEDLLTALDAYYEANGSAQENAVMRAYERYCLESGRNRDAVARLRL